jgi:hypothetical protein
LRGYLASARQIAAPILRLVIIVLDDRELGYPPEAPVTRATRPVRSFRDDMCNTEQDEGRSTLVGDVTSFGVVYCRFNVLALF